MLQLMVNDGLVDCSADVAENLELGQLCLEEARSALAPVRRMVTRKGDRGSGRWASKRQKGEIL